MAYAFELANDAKSFSITPESWGNLMTRLIIRVLAGLVTPGLVWITPESWWNPMIRIIRIS